MIHRTDQQLSEGREVVGLGEKVKGLSKKIKKKRKEKKKLTHGQTTEW